MLDQNKIEEFKALETKEAKMKLEEYGKEFGIDLKRNKSFENMLESLEAHVEANSKEDASEETVDTKEESTENDASEEVQESEETQEDEQKSETEETQEASEDETTKEPSESNYPGLVIKPEETSKDDEASESDEESKDSEADDSNKASDSDETKEEVKEVDLSAPGEEVELPEGFKPKFNLSFYNRGKGFRFASLGYWIVDEIKKLGDDWKCKADKSRYSKELLTIIYYIRRYGEVTIRESRNSQYVTFK